MPIHLNIAYSNDLRQNGPCPSSSSALLGPLLYRGVGILRRVFWMNNNPSPSSPCRKDP